ncbi:MAG: hypothetical protein RLZZ387_397 [Chloroflexota bacterium]|jgi:hypothetical protein
MDTSTDRIAYVERLLTRLRRQYVERAPLPVREGEEPASLSFDMLRRLCQQVLAEGYGEREQ